ncbi:MAG TPA: CaiB/BaiF CoA-transferase family protein [Acidimicrobiales bacterium]|jgi:alpha-methylacyl-CoA racemase|nr:CaiB/BaiF CoA-transferase family protein [Acidimicrobiales bacterium]
MAGNADEGTRSGPLVGLRVLELAGIGPGPVAGRLLADMGAEVIRVERPGQPTDVAWPVTMCGRRSVVLDLKDPAEVESLLRIAAGVDVIIDPFRPGVAERLGVGPEQCTARNGRLIYARITGWGQDGPLAQTAGHDIDYIAVTGALHAIGRSDSAPVPPLNLLGDFGGGTMFLVVGILAALWERERSGRGQVVDAAIVDGTIALTGYIHGMRAAGRWSDERGTNRLDTGAPYYDVYETADGGWMAVGALEDKFWNELVTALDLAGEIADAGIADRTDPEAWPRLRGLLAERFRGRDRDEWAELFGTGDACVAPVLAWPEVAAHPHIRHRQSLVERDGVSQPAPAPRFSRTPAQMSAPATVRSGHDTDAVLDEFGGRPPATGGAA